MVSSDTIVGIVGAVILTGAMIAVFYYEAGRDTGDGNQEFEYTWASRETPATTHDGETLTQGDSNDYPVELPAYAAQVRIEVTWQPTSDPVGGNAVITPEFRITFAGHDEQGDSSPLALEHTFSGNASAPADLSIRAANETAANATVQQQLLDAAPAAMQATVTLVSDGYPDGTPAQLKEATSFNVRIIVEYWTAVPAATAPAT